MPIDVMDREKSVSYKQMTELWAWKDFMVWLESERLSALELAINSDELKDIQTNRGIIKGLDKIKNHVGYIIGQR